MFVVSIPFHAGEEEITANHLVPRSSKGFARVFIFGA
jgi:hypothetical protein